MQKRNHDWKLVTNNTQTPCGNYHSIQAGNGASGEPWNHATYVVAWSAQYSSPLFMLKRMKKASMRWHLLRAAGSYYTCLVYCPTSSPAGQTRPPRVDVARRQFVVGSYIAVSDRIILPTSARTLFLEVHVACLLGHRRVAFLPRGGMVKQTKVPRLQHVFSVRGVLRCLGVAMGPLCLNILLTTKKYF